MLNTADKVRSRRKSEVRKHTLQLAHRKTEKRTPQSRGDPQEPENLVSFLGLPFKISEGSSSPNVVVSVCGEAGWLLSPSLLCVMPWSGLQLLASVLAGLCWPEPTSTRPLCCQTLSQVRRWGRSQSSWKFTLFVPFFTWLPTRGSDPSARCPIKPLRETF